MKVVLQTPSELVVHDGRWQAVLMGSVLLAVGGVFVVMPIGFGAVFAWIIRAQRNTVALEATHLVPEVNA